MPSSHRGNGEGTIFQRRDGKWCAALYDHNGRRKWLYGKSRQEVVRKLAAAIRQRDQGVALHQARQTVGAYLTGWLADTAQHRLRPATYVRYQCLVERHALPTLGKLSLRQLGPQHLSKLYGDKLAEGLAPRTVQFLHAILHSALKQALRWRLVEVNAADAVQAPRPKRQPMHPLDHDQADRLLDAIEGDAFEALYTLALMVGMRQGELLGLTWADVDWPASRLQIRHTLQWPRGGQWQLDAPKTGLSRRTIKLPGSGLAALKAHRARQAEQRLAAGPAWEDTGLVFTNALGRPINPSNLLTRSWAPLKRRCALPPATRFHDLRHTYATLALRDGVPVKVVSETLGHASITITLDTYSHVLPDMQDEAAERMEKLLGRGRNRKAPQCEEEAE